MSTSTVITYINRAVERYRELGRTVGNISDAIREATADGFLDLPGASWQRIGPLGSDRETHRAPSYGSVTVG
ncbi:MAG TPA: hypothetical protein PKX10_00810 [Propioniciclava tarda]|nr:hypothetical protein [Propioniciclava tarda]HQA29949.1 hypothetical protein [Propioniciclava tarda]